MNTPFRLEINTEDQAGITLKILQKIYERQINISAMEVFPNRICIKSDPIPLAMEKQLTEDLKEIKEVRFVRKVDLLAFEENQRRLRAVIDSVDEGVIALNRDMEITFFNSYSENLLGFREKEIAGRNIKSFLGKNQKLTEHIEAGESYANVELVMKNERLEGKYLATGQSIKNENGEIIGSVITVKDYKKVHEMAEIAEAISNNEFENIIGNSNEIRQVKKICTAIAKSDSTVLIQGESGTGKELFARAIKNLSNRKSKKFITINCAAIPETLLESELFGYERGSFTGALDQGKEGLFKEADGGTLFLDEIGELTMSMQAKLLRVLQEGVVRKIGSSKEEKVDVRIISATNKNLEEQIQAGAFRNDLYYRLNVIPLYIPPLRERKEDIPLLTGFFINKINKKLHKNISSADMTFIQELMNYQWPGNVRELENVVERAANLTGENILSRDHLLFDKIGEKAILPPGVPSGSNPGKSLKDIMGEIEKTVIIQALKKNQTIRKAAQELNLSHTALIKKISKYELETKDWK